MVGLTKMTYGFMVAIETVEGEESLPDAGSLSFIVEQRLQDMGYDISSVSVEALGEIQCYEGEGEG